MTNWKNKLLAFLHDPPSKAFDIPNHESLALTLLRQAGFSEEEARQFSRQADWAASAADRLPFPASQASGLRCHFDGVRNAFHHPLGSGKEERALTLPFQGEFVTSELAHETDQTVQPVLADFGRIPDDSSNPCGERWRARFFAHWRLWQMHAAGRDYRFAFLPADTRIPDHTIWTHMQVVSALAGCVPGDDPAGAPKPAFLKFQIGPVQDFIAAARSIRDLWSGSYLLSWLMAAALKAFSEEAGPDAVVYPSLRNQPLFDLHWRDDLWRETAIGTKTVWESLKHESTALLVPNLPNVFLAIAPANRDQVRELGSTIETAVRNELKAIAARVWDFCDAEGMFEADGSVILKADRKARFETQVSQFLAVSWQATPWPNSLSEALHLADTFAADMPVKEARERVEAITRMAEKSLPLEHRDRRYYTDDTKTKLNNLGLGWSVILALNGWQLDAVRQTRCFEACNDGGWRVGVFNNKDSLDGRVEAVAGGDNWAKLAESKGGLWQRLFKHSDWLGALTLIKRVWHLAYLRDLWKLETDHGKFKMPNTRGIAAHRPFDDCGDDETAEDATPSEKYFAVLALDGDNIGKWVSGEVTPKFATQLADYRDGTGKDRQGAAVYFESRVADLLKTRRPLSPSYHLQFSEALTNFALLCAKPVVEVFDGRLIYAGGDDVLALLPADSALACAEALRAAFTGRASLAGLLQASAKAVPDQDRTYAQSLAALGKLCSVYESREGMPHEGFLVCGDRGDQVGRPIPFIVPGPAADCSVGIAIAHFKAPLQDVVREAQRAERRAKAELKKSAVAVTLMKRSGEILQWGCHWQSGGIELLKAVQSAMLKEHLSGKFPHRLVELLSPYLTRQTGVAKLEAVAEFESEICSIIQRDFETALQRQRGPAWPKNPELGAALSGELLDGLRRFLGASGQEMAEDRLRAIIGLCETAAFSSRTQDEH